MEKGVTYDYDQESKKLKKSTKSIPKGLTPRQQKTTKKNRKKDRTGSDPFWPREA